MMVTNYKEWGASIKASHLSNLKSVIALKTYKAIIDSTFCNFIEIRKHPAESFLYDEIIILDIKVNVPSKNALGIQCTERIALEFSSNLDLQPTIRALRENFPDTFHQYHVRSGEPPSLCIYNKTWSALKLTWTPQKLLRDIREWLEKITIDELHQDNQPLEPFFFNHSYFKIVLPVNFYENFSNKNLCFLLHKKPSSTHKKIILEGFFSKKEQGNASENFNISTLVVETLPIEHGKIERTPTTLGELDQVLKTRSNINILDLIGNEISNKKTITGSIEQQENPYILLIIKIPLYRKNKIENTQTKGFIINCDLAELGVKLDFLTKLDGKFHFFQSINGQRRPNEDWKNVTLENVEILQPIEPSFAQLMSGIYKSCPNGIVAGVGSLGGALVNIWLREGWANLTLVDHDIVNPHNLARHPADHNQIGLYKTQAIKEIESYIFPNNTSLKSIEDNILNFTNSNITQSLQCSDFLIDATTTLEVPRKLSKIDDSPRSLSIFFNPTGTDSVLLIEDKKREIRLDILELNYYYYLLNDDIGNNHLTAHNKSLWVGTGCRDKSFTIPYNHINLHASILAGQVRKSLSQNEAHILIWSYKEDSGEISHKKFSPSISLSIKKNDFTIIWTQKTQDKLWSLRKNKLPNETGGIIVGYYDFSAYTIYIVDVYASPSDSLENPNSFIRGKDDLFEKIEDTKARTQGIVNYIGEWHSHPDNVSIQPSKDDCKLADIIANQLREEGYPMLMLIVGKNNLNWILKDDLNHA